MSRSATLFIYAIAVLLQAGSQTPAQASTSPTFHCTQTPCPYTLSGDSFQLRLRDLEYRCRSATGSGALEFQTAGWTAIRLHGCREHVTPFAFSCAGLEGNQPTIGTRALGTSTLEEGGAPELLLDSVHLAFTCGGLAKVQIEGYFVGEIDPGDCGSAGRRYQMRMELIGHGREGRGPNYDVYVDGYGGEQYEWSSSWPLRFDKRVWLDC